MIAPQPFYEDRGTPIVLRRVLQAISQNGHEIKLITFPPGVAVSIDGLQIKRVGTFLRIRNIPIGFSMKKLILDMFLLPAIIGQLRREHYDCIHAVEESAFPALLAARLYKLPLLYDMQSDMPEQLQAYKLFSLAPVYSVLQRLERFLVRRADLVMCSVGLKEHVENIAPETAVREWHYPTSDTVLPISAGDELEFDLDLPVDRYVILYTGNFASYQGVDRLVRAMPSVLEEIPNAVFVFVGSMSGESLPGLYECRVPESAVRVVPRQPQEQMAGYLSMADVLVSPRAPVGNLPLKVLEYMSSKRPIIATDTKAHRSVLHDDSALLVDHKEAAFAAAIVKLYKNPELAERLAANAYQFALKELGWDRFIAEVEEIYTNVGNTAHTA